MKRLLKLVRAACLIAGIGGALLAVWMLIDPSVFASSIQNGMIEPPSPRWRAAFLLVFSMAAAAFGGGMLTHREHA